jgi:hypothetical protein
METSSGAEGGLADSLGGSGDPGSTTTWVAVHQWIVDLYGNDAPGIYTV